MKNINRASLFGSCFPKSTSAIGNSLGLNDAVYLSPCAFDKKEYGQNHIIPFCPIVNNLSYYNNVIMEYVPLVNGKGLSYSFNIIEIGKYVFCIKFSKLDNLSSVSSLVFNVKYPSSYVKKEDSNDYEVSYTVNKSKRIVLNFDAFGKDERWLVFEFENIAVGKHEFSLDFYADNFEALPGFKSNFFVEAVAAMSFDKMSYDQFEIPDEYDVNLGRVFLCKPVNINENNVLHHSKFINNKSEYGAKIFTKILKRKFLENQDPYGSQEVYLDTLSWFYFNLEDFDVNERKVNAYINGFLTLSEEDVYDISFLFLEDYKKDYYHFSYSHDYKSTSGKTFSINSDGDLEILKNTIAFDIYENDNKVENTGKFIFGIPAKKIVINPPSGENIEYNDISSSDLAVREIENFSLLSDEVGKYYSLSLPERHQAFVLDNSGSMSWSDRKEERFKIIEGTVESFNLLYPGDVSYSITSFMGTPIIVNWFGAPESEIIDSNNPDEARRAFLKNKFTNFKGVHIVRKSGSEPVSPTDGEIVFDGYDSVYYDTGLNEGEIYYYAIYPVDNSNRLGSPSIVEARTRSGDITEGIKSLSAKEMIGTGVRRDSDAFIILHMDEGSGNYIYDFSGNRLNFSIVDQLSNAIFWLDKSESPTISRSSNITKGSGIRSLGGNSYLEYKGYVYKKFDGFTFSCWINPVEANEEKDCILFKISSTIGSFSIVQNNKIVKLYARETLCFKIDNFFTFDEWSHISFSINSSISVVELYKNGSYFSSVNISEFSSLFQDVLSNEIDSIFIAGDGSDSGFVGKITELSVFTRQKNDEEIYSEYASIPLDNGDRLLVFNWFSHLDLSDSRIIISYKQESGPLRLLDQDIAGPANFGQYQGDASANIPPNTVDVPQSDLGARICFGDDIGPVSSSDGSIIYDSYIHGLVQEWSFIESFSPSLTESQQQMVKAGGFRHFFRIFRISDDGVESPPDDSGLVEYTCKSFESSSLAETEIGSVYDVSTYSGNKKIRINWNIEDKDDIDSIVVYYSDEPIPPDFLSGNNSTNSQIYTVFAADKSFRSFTHFYGRVRDSQRRSGGSDGNFSSLVASNYETDDDLDNGKTAYYAIVLRDRYGREGAPYLVDATPSSSSDDSGIGPERVIAARSYPVDYKSISIKWINPIGASRFFDIEAWLDDNIILFFKITDIYGKSLNQYDNFETIFRFNDSLNGIVGRNDEWSPGLAGPESGNIGLFDVFGRAPIVTNIGFSDIVSYSQSNILGGWVRTVVTTANASQLSRNLVDFAYTTVSMKMVKNNNFGSDPQFSFTTQPIRIWIKNPLRLSLIVNDLVPYLPRNISSSIPSGSDQSICGYGDLDGSSGIGNEYYLFGCFAGRVRPYSFQVIATYKGLPLPSGATVDITIFDDNEVSMGSNPSRGQSYSIPEGFEGVVGFNPELGTPLSNAANYAQIEARDSYRESSIIVPTSPSVTLFNSPDNRFSLGICQIRVPISRSFGRIFASLSVGDFSKSYGFYAAFSSSLYLRLSASSPLPDGSDLARQYAYAYIVDPNKFSLSYGQIESSDFAIESFSQPVPDGTPILWRLSGLRNSQNRPFYSTSQNSPGGGVIDRTVDGVSGNVVFGPISNPVSTIISNGDSIILIPEEYLVSATVSYNGLIASASYPLCVYPFRPSSDELAPIIQETSFYFAGKSFGKSDGNIQYVYCDGEDFATLEVIRDPRLLLSSQDDPRIDDIRAFCKCYNADGINDGIPNAYLSSLPENHLVEIYAIKLPDCQGDGVYPYFKGSVEILYGNDIYSYIDSDGVTQIGSSESGMDRVIINTEDRNRSIVGIRSNYFMPLKWKYFSKLQADIGQASSASCDDFYSTPNPLLPIEPHVYLSASTSVINQFSERFIFSDGSPMSGNPPKMIKFIEPLYIKLAYIKKNDIKLFDNYIDFDGTSEYELVFVIKFAGRPVPDNTLVKFYKCGSSSVTLKSSVGYTEVREEVGFWSYDENGIFETSRASFVSVKINPLSPVNPIFASIFAEVNYDKKGSVFRQRVHGIDLFYGGGANFSSTRRSSDNQDPSSDDVESGDSIPPAGGGNSQTPPGSDIGSSLSPFPEIVKDSENSISRLFVNNLITKSCYIYDSAVSDQEFIWRKIADMNIRRAMHVSEYVQGNLYSIGGLSGYGSDPADALSTITLTNSCEKWNILSNNWIGVSSSPTNRFGCMSCNDGRYIYVIGGFESVISQIRVGDSLQNAQVPRVSRRLERYDTVNNIWESFSPMPVLDIDGNIVPVNVDSVISGSLNLQNSFLDSYGVAFGKAIIFEQHIVIVAGAKDLDNFLNVKKYNDRFLIYSIIDNSWKVSERIPENLISEFLRINPVAWIDKDIEYNIIITGGSSSRIESNTIQFGNQEFSVENTVKFAVQNSFSLSLFDLIKDIPSIESLDRCDNIFAQLPRARDQVAHISSYSGKNYIFGGRVFPEGENFGTNATRASECIYLNNGRYFVEKLLPMPFGRSSFGISEDSDRLVFITGGITTGQAPGFVRLDVSAFGEQTEQVNSERVSVVERADAYVRLDGFSGVDIKIRAYDDEGEPVSGVLEVELSGLLSYGDGSDSSSGGSSIGGFRRSVSYNRRRARKGTRVYPILIEPRIVKCNNGIGYSRVIGRSEDILKSISEIQQILNIDLANDELLLGSNSGYDLVQGKVRFPYRITVVGNVVDDFYFGKTNYVSPDDSGDAVLDDLFIPESEVSDLIADAGDLGDASIIPPMLPGYAGDRAPIPIFNMGPVLTCSVVGVIGPKGDVDLFRFSPQRNGLYIITVEPKGFSNLKPRVKIFGENGLPYIVGETGSNEIRFLSDGQADGIQEVDFFAGSNYYIQVDSYAFGDDDDTMYVGEYRLRITLPISISQNDNIDNSSGSNQGASGSEGADQDVFNIIEYLPESISSIDNSAWLDILISYYNGYFRMLISNSSFNQNALDVAVQTITDLVSCPFSCPRCRRSSGSDESRSCLVGTFECNGSDNVSCDFLNGNGSILLPSFESSSSSSSEFYDPYDPYDPYLPLLDEYNPYSVTPIFIPPLGSNEIIFETISFSSVSILSSSIFSSDGSGLVSEGESPVIQYYSDIDWIPVVDSVIFSGNSAYSEIKNYIRKIKQKNPFGSSPIYDGIEYAVRLIKNNFDSDEVIKNIILLSDNDENSSSNSPLQVSESISGIDGDKKVKLNVFNINTSYPVTTSALASRANLSDVNVVMRSSGGQCFSFFDNNFLEEALEFAFSGSAGSAGSGRLALEIDFSEPVIVNSILPKADTGNADTISYTISYSDNGNEYTNIGMNYDINSSSSINKKCRFIKILFLSVLDFSAINYYENPYDPYISKMLSKIRSLSLSISPSDDTYIFTKQFNLNSSPQQCMIYIDWDGPSETTISAGVSLIESGDWKDYESDSRPFVRGSGKIIVPIRSKDRFGLIKENLEQIGPYTYSLPHGSVNRNSKYDIFDASNNLVNSSMYYLDIDEGIVRFSSPQVNNSYYIEISENKAIKIGIKVNFGPSKDPVYINALGFMINTNQELAPLSFNQKPIAIGVKISPSQIYPYSNIRAMYQYFDSEGDVEDVEKRIIKWYRNGVEITELLNVTSFNDLFNVDDVTYNFFYTSNYAELQNLNVGQPPDFLASLNNERLFEPGDQVYFTIQVHDGNQYSDIFRSRTLTVENYPLTPERLTIRSRFAPYQVPNAELFTGNNGGSNLPSIGSLANEFTNRTSLFADFDLFNTTAFSSARIEWWVTPRLGTPILFKSGLISSQTDFAYVLGPQERNLITQFEAIKIDHQIYARLIIPANTAIGLTSERIITSNTVVIENSVPICSFVRISSPQTDFGSLVTYVSVRYSVYDEDIVQNDFVPGTSTFQSSSDSIVRLYRQDVSGEDFILDNRFGPNADQIDLRSGAFEVRSLFDSGTKIYVEVVPYDGFVYGASVASDIYEVP
jgi:hypothetical protein